MKLSNQHIKILGLMNKFGGRGVNSYDLTFVHGIKQAPTRVREMRVGGYLIKSRRNRDASVNYILLGEVSKNPSETIVAPQKGIADVIREGMDNQVRVWSEKLGRYTWEDRVTEQLNYDF